MVSWFIYYGSVACDSNAMDPRYKWISLLIRPQSKSTPGELLKLSKALV